MRVLSLSSRGSRRRPAHLNVFAPPSFHPSALLSVVTFMTHPVALLHWSRWFRWFIMLPAGIDYILFSVYLYFTCLFGPFLTAHCASNKTRGPNVRLCVIAANSSFTPPFGSFEIAVSALPPPPSPSLPHRQIPLLSTRASYRVSLSSLGEQRSIEFLAARGCE